MLKILIILSIEVEANEYNLWFKSDEVSHVSVHKIIQNTSTHLDSFETSPSLNVNRHAAVSTISDEDHCCQN